MNPYRIVHLTNVRELRSAAANWDDLWWRSYVTMPTMRADLLAEWLDQFVCQNDFRAIVVEQDGRWLAALPLISDRFAKVLTAAALPRNPWLPCGDLLLDPNTETEAVLAALLSAAADLRWPLFWLNYASLDSRYWKAFAAVCRQQGVLVAEHARYQVANIRIAESWDAFTKNLSRSHRQATQKAERRLQKLGDLQLLVQSQLAAEEVPAWLQKVFAVEDLSWKGESGSSVLRSPGMGDFLLRQARHLARLGQLELALLELDGRAIASMFGFSAKGVYHAHKIGYDPQYGQYSPGQVMFWRLLEQMHAQGGWKSIDCIGPITEATSRWRPSTYTIGRLAFAPRKLIGRITLQAYRHVWPMIRRLRGASAPPERAPESQDAVSSEAPVGASVSTDSLGGSA
jgi:CelD/BcsL family acetyltransferase involved in cellulose biosynthesis